MMALEWPWALLALPLPLLARALPRAKESVGVALKLPFQAGPPAVVGAAARRPSRLRLTLAILAWGLLVLAAGRPQWVGEPMALPVAGRDLMLALDISGSMDQEDYELNGRPVSRLGVVQAVAVRFVERRDQDRLGLILFGTRAYLQTPLTFDAATVATMLGEAVVGLAGRETAIGDAIGLAIKRFREQPEGNRVLILLTDGENTAGALDPLVTARLAAQSGVRIHTIGIGGGEVGIRTPFGLRLRRPSADFDPETLKQIAAVTGGRFFSASSREQLETVYAELDRLEPNERDERTYRPVRALFVWPASVSLLVTAWLAVGSLRARG